MSKLYRVHRKPDAGNGQAEAINPEAIRTVVHSQLAMKQKADEFLKEGGRIYPEV
ncbi:MAG: hypothetical protein IPN92_12260 [Chromatiaceae bacterium]|nr:hypothetical protein [Chromatiaceae bacterium]